MADLYYRPALREVPGALPFQAQTPGGEWRTDLAAHPESVEECGFVRAPERPEETAETVPEWDAGAEAWVMVDRPPAPAPVVDPYAHFVPISLLRQRLEKLALFDDFSAYLAQFPTLMFKVLSLERGVDPDYPDLQTAFDALSVPQATRDYLMADPGMGVPDV